MRPFPGYDNETRLEGERSPTLFTAADCVIRRQLTPAGALLADLDAQVRALALAPANDDAPPSTLPAPELPPCA